MPVVENPPYSLVSVRHVSIWSLVGAKRQTRLFARLPGMALFVPWPLSGRV